MLAVETLVSSCDHDPIVLYRVLKSLEALVAIARAQRSHRLGHRVI